jgi:hypothetical protein
MIFGKKHEQTMKHLQFKFDPLPTELIDICLFLRGGYKIFSMQTTGELWIKYDIISFKIWLFYFCNIFLVDASQKNPFFALRK